MKTKARDPHPFLADLEKKKNTGQTLLESMILLPLFAFAFMALSQFLIQAVEKKQRAALQYNFGREAFSESVHSDKTHFKTQDFETLTGNLTLRRESKGHRVTIQDITRKSNIRENRIRKDTLYLEK